MGKSRTPKYRLEVTDASGTVWQTGFDGEVTVKDWIERFNASVCGGVNAHLGLGAIAVAVRLISQKGPLRGQVLEEVNA